MASENTFKPGDTDNNLLRKILNVLSGGGGGSGGVVFQSQLDAEEAAREAADTNLQNQIDAIPPSISVESGTSSKISAMTASGALSIDDLTVVVDDPAGTPTNKKATVQQVHDSVNVLSAASTPLSVSDKVGITQSGTGKAATVQDVLDAVSQVATVTTITNNDYFLVNQGGVSKKGQSVNLPLLQALRYRRISLFIAGGSSGSGGFTSIGDAHVETGSGAYNAADATRGPYNTYTTAASSGSDAGLNGNLNYVVNRNIDMSFRCNFSATTLIRMFIGVTDQTLATAVSADDPAGNYAGFQFSTVRGDANFQAVTKNGTTQGVSNTLIAFDTSPHEFRIVFRDSDGAIDFYIDDVLKITRATNLPTTGTALRYVLGVETESGSTRQINIEWFQIDTDF